MKLSFDSQKVIVDEFQYVANRLRKESEIANRIYVYSAAHAAVNRILNIEFDPRLMLMHTILQTTHAQINNTLVTIATGAEKVITIPEGLFNYLAQNLQDLADALLKDGDMITPLERIAIAGYVTTGNGYYLYQKGILKL
jgi:hypothetical protein